MVDLQTSERHKRHDSSKRVRDALAMANTACKNQDDDIASHFASLSLFPDRPTNPGASHRSTPVKTGSGKSTEQRRVEEILYRLRDIEISLDDLVNSVDGKLGRVGSPGTTDEIFPLLSSISTGRTIRSQLSQITSRAASVQETKSSLLMRLGEVVSKLEHAKHSWNKHAEGLPSEKNFETIFSSGKPRLQIKTSLCLISFMKNITIRQYCSTPTR